MPRLNSDETVMWCDVQIVVRHSRWQESGIWIVIVVAFNNIYFASSKAACYIQEHIEAERGQTTVKAPNWIGHEFWGEW